MPLKNILLFLFSTICMGSIFAQSFSDTIYYNAHNQQVDSLNSNGYYRVVSNSNDNTYLFTVKEFYASDTIKMSGKFRSINPDKKEGNFLYYYPNGKLKRECNYKNNKLNGEYLSYYLSGAKKTKSFYKANALNGTSITWHENGAVKKEIQYKFGIKNGYFKTYYNKGELLRSEVYKEGKRISEKCFTKDGNDTTYFEYITPPTFMEGTISGFTNWILEKIDVLYSDQNITDKTSFNISFTVTKNGVIDKIKVPDLSSPATSSEIIQLLKNSPLWSPGKKDLETIDTKVRIPIAFK